MEFSWKFSSWRLEHQWLSRASTGGHRRYGTASPQLRNPPHVSLRRSLMSANPRVERFAILRDHRTSRAVAEMTAKPGGAHRVDSLAKTACLRRPTFMARFHEPNHPS